MPRSSGVGALKAAAKFHADMGDYAVDDEEMLKLLATSGEHPIIVTVLAGQDSDLLDGTLKVSGPASQIATTATVMTMATHMDCLAQPGFLAPWCFWQRSRGSLAEPARLPRHRQRECSVTFSMEQSKAKQDAQAHQYSCHSAFRAGNFGFSLGGAQPTANGEHLDAPATTSASGLMRLPDGSVNVPMLAQRRLGIRTQLTPESEAAATMELPGRVVVDPNASGRVQAIHGGRIEAGPRGLPVAGQTVRQGEVLAYVAHHAEPYALANKAGPACRTAQ